MTDVKPFCICSIDKDFYQVPGWHYNFVKQEFREVTPLEGLRNFYGQLIMGDRADNIPGYDGKMRQKIPKFLEEHFYMLSVFNNEYDMYEYVLDMYHDKDQFLVNAQCLWLLRNEGEFWQKPEPTMTESGQSPDSMPL